MPDSSGAKRQFVRPVDQCVVHGKPVSFRTLCEQVIPEHTDYIVLDLDHTVHLHRNMGEIFGWELSVRRAYDRDYLEEVAASRSPGRGYLDLKRPMSIVRYGLDAVGNWALPGLFYFFWAKIVCKTARTNWLAYRRFGVDPRRAIQSVPQQTLFRIMAGLPLEELRSIARAVWRRHKDDQVVTRDDIAWLKNRCPNLKVILSSASPQPVLEVASEELGVDGILYSRVEEHDGCLSLPLWRRALRRSLALSNRISTPEQQIINAREVKVARLQEAFPDIFSSATHTIGMTDTAYGEDHCWTEHFDAVVDVNSSDPFPPIVGKDSPLKEIHSALLLSRAEISRRALGQRAFMDSKRKLSDQRDGQFGAAELKEILSGQLGKMEQLSDRYLRTEEALEAKRDGVLAEIQSLRLQLQASVEGYNEADVSNRRDALGDVRAQLAQLERRRADLITMERPLAELVWKIEGVLHASRGALAYGGV